MHAFVLHLDIILPRHEHGCLSEDVFGRECQAKGLPFFSHIFGFNQCCPGRCSIFLRADFLSTCLFRLYSADLATEDSGSGNPVVIESPQKKQHLYLHFYTWHILVSIACMFAFLSATIPNCSSTTPTILP